MVRYRTTRWDSDPWQAFSARSGDIIATVVGQARVDQIDQKAYV